LREPYKYVSELSAEDTEFIEKSMETSNSFRISRRCHVILLSSRRFSVSQIAEIHDIQRDTVSKYIDAWEKHGWEGLREAPRPGRPPGVKGRDMATVKKIIEKSPQFPRKIIAEINRKTGIAISSRTLRRLVKKMRIKWKRVRKSLKKQRSEKAFRKAQEDIRVLISQHMSGEKELFFFDQTGFSIGSYVPYAYQPVGKTIEISAICHRRLNVAGFFSPDSRLTPFCFEHSADSETVIAFFDNFAEHADRKKKTVVILDNSPVHHSDEFYKKIPEWNKKGIFIKYIPPYSPELNRIEILWKSIKYRWLDISSYTSFRNLVRNVEHVLKNVGKEYFIEFS